MFNKQFTIQSNYDAVMKLNLEVKSFYSLLNLVDQDINELEIILVESLNNIVKHSYLEKTDEIIDVDIKIQKSIWECRLKDYGISRNFFEIPDLEFDPTDIQNLPEGGMGLFLINKLTDINDYKIFDTFNEFYLRKTCKIKLHS